MPKVIVITYYRMLSFMLIMQYLLSGLNIFVSLRSEGHPETSYKPRVLKASEPITFLLDFGSLYTHLYINLVKTRGKPVKSVKPGDPSVKKLSNNLLV